MTVRAKGTLNPTISNSELTYVHKFSTESQLSDVIITESIVVTAVSSSHCVDFSPIMT